jgi:hypothetical protein
MAEPTADRVPLRELRSRTELADSGNAELTRVSSPEDSLFVEGGLVVVELQVGQVG